MKNRKLALFGAIALAAFAGGWLWAGRGQDAGPRTKVVMYQNPACGCCSKWARHMRANGFDVEIHKTADLNRIKEREGITAETAACHTAFVEGYVIEGHVPARDVQRLLRERPDVAGISVPGMPMGAPGMEGSYTDRYDVLSFDKAGHTSVFSTY